MRRLRLITFVCSLSLILPLIEGGAAVSNQAVRETVEFLMRHHADDATRIGAETLTREATELGARYGEEALTALRNAGPRTASAVRAAGDEGPQAIQLLARHGEDGLWLLSTPSGLDFFTRYGDDAARALLKHRGSSEALIREFGSDAAQALNAINRQNGRRLAMLKDEGYLNTVNDVPGLMNVIKQYGDNAMDFIWRNKGPLAVTAVLTTFIANPEPYINGTKDLLIDAGVAITARTTTGTKLALAGLLIIALIGIRFWWRISRPRIG